MSFFVASEALLENLRRAIQWGFIKETPNWCEPYDRFSESGCNWWQEGPPTLSTCRQCPVSQFFCRGCERLPGCEIHPFPKVWPVLTRFMTRFNMAEVLHQPIWTRRDWRDIPRREYQLITVAMRTMLDCRAKDTERAIKNAGKR